MKIHQSMLGSIKYLRPLYLEIQNSALACGSGTILDFKVLGSQIFNRAQHLMMYFYNITPIKFIYSDWSHFHGQSGVFKS